MHLVDAVIEIARADTPGKWARYCEIAPRVWSVTDAPRELLRRARLTRGSYDGTQSGWSDAPEAAETAQLEEVFLTAFVAAVHAGRYRVRGFRRGDLEATDIPAALITVDAFRHLRGEKWWLGGVVWFGMDVIAGPPPSPKLRPASHPQIHAEIKAEYDDCATAGRKPPNMKEIGKPVRDRLRAKGRDASLNQIQKLAGDPRYDGLRLKPGEQRKAGKTPPERS